ncbi:MAG TPA: hypothetical protein VMV82_03075 [Candidatus Dormibacteraeota bacterium]|nr:hypothetical protein [Candidatus Dormibacteraeota bacterium]
MAPAANVTPNQNNYGLLVDSSGRVFVADASSNGLVSVLTPPFVSSSTPAFNLTVSSGNVVYGMAFDGSGDLWVTEEVGGGSVWEIKAPITSASTAVEVLSGISNAYGIAFGP